MNGRAEPFEDSRQGTELSEDTKYFKTFSEKKLLSKITSNKNTVQ